MTKKGLSRHTLESCTTQLSNWRPFLPSSEIPILTPQASAATAVSSDSSSKQKSIDLNGLMEILGAMSESQMQGGTGSVKKQCLSDRGSHKNPCDLIDMSTLSLLEDDGKMPIGKALRREKDIEKTNSFDRLYHRSIPPISFAHIARKRRRRGSCSGSGRSSDKSRTRIHGSDPPTRGVSATYATCSDFPIAGTDSSGELFYYGDGNWASEMVVPINEVKNTSGAFKREGKDIGGEPSCSWQGIDIQSNESDYGSEPGYRGDEELGYGEDGVGDELDEEDDVEIRCWGKLFVYNSALGNDGHSKFDMSEDDDQLLVTDNMQLVGKSASQEQRVHHRFRRRRQDWRMESHGSRHSLVSRNN